MTKHEKRIVALAYVVAVLNVASFVWYQRLLWQLGAYQDLLGVWPW